MSVVADVRTRLRFKIKMKKRYAQLARNTAIEIHRDKKKRRTNETHRISTCVTECGDSMGKRIAERKENPSSPPFLKERISSHLRLNAARVKDNYKINVGIIVNVVIKRMASVERTRKHADLIEKAPQEKQGTHTET